MQTIISCHSLTLGRSVEDRAIEGVLFGAETLPDDDWTLDTLLVGVFHGDEGVSGRLLQRLIEHWQIGTFSGAAIDFALRPVLVIPVLNPDGLEARRRVNARGVDLNRNWPTVNWAEDHRGTAYDSGPEAASEPETQALMALITQHKPKKIITVHSPYKVLNFDGPARELANAMAAASGYPVVEDIGYATPGSFGTWAGKERHLPVITLELPPSPDDPPHDDQALPPEPFDSVWTANHAALEAAVQFDGLN